jgi:hypothetical protein
MAVPPNPAAWILRSTAVLVHGHALAQEVNFALGDRLAHRVGHGHPQQKLAARADELASALDAVNLELEAWRANGPLYRPRRRSAPR